jgi:hypothetical protein
MLRTSAFVWVSALQPGSRSGEARAGNLIYPQFLQKIPEFARGGPKRRDWYAACITKVTCDGRPEQGNKIPGTKEQDNGKDECKAGNQDRDSGRRDGRYIHRCKRSVHFRRRRGPAHSLPTQAAELLDDSAAELEGSWLKATRLTKPAVVIEAELWVRNLWADGDNRNPSAIFFLALDKFALPHPAMLERHQTSKNCSRRNDQNVITKCASNRLESSSDDQDQRLLS